MAIAYKSGINIDGNSTVTGTFSVSSVTQDNSSYTGIMVWDGGVLKYRTKAQILSDIGAGSGSGTVSSVSLGTLTGLSGSITNATSTPTITLTNTDTGSAQNIFKTIAVSGQTSIAANSNSTTLTVVGAGGMTVTTDNSTKTLTLTSANDNDNHYLTSVSFNTSTGVLTFNRNGLSATTVDIDGRYVEKTGDTMTGQLFMDNAGILIDPDSAGYVLQWRESDSTTIAGQLRSYANRGDIYLNSGGTKTTEITAGSGSFMPDLALNNSNSGVPGTFSETLYVNGIGYTTNSWQVGTASTYVGKLFNSSGVLTLQADTGRSITLDAGGDITLDADGADIIFKDAGSTFGKITNSSQNLQLWVSTNDKDLVFKGYDNSSAITALTLDMSAAGFATFNSGGTFSGNVTAPAFYVSGGSSGTNYIDVISNDLYIVANQKSILYSGNAETLRLETTGQVEFDKYGSQTFTGTSASYLIATSSGDIIEKTPAQVRSDIGAVSSSGVTSIATSTGITGGTITSTGTLKIDYTGSDSVIQSAPGINSISKEDTFIINTAEDGNVYETSISNLSSTFGIHTGTGTANTLAKWTGTSALGNSEITDTGALVKIGSNSSGQETLYIDTQNRKVGFRTQTPGSAFDVNGTFRARNEINCGVTNEQNLFVAGGTGAQYVKMGAYTSAGNFLGIASSENLLKTTAGFGANGKIVQASRFYTTKIESGGWPTAAGMANGKALTPTPGSNQVMYIRNIFINKTSTDTGTGWSSGTYPIEFGWLGSGSSASRFIAGVPRQVIISTNPNTWWYQVTINAESNNPYGTPFGPVANKPLILNTPAVISSQKQPTMYIQVEYTLVNISNFRTNVDQTYT